MMDETARAARIVAAYAARRWQIATAESCTGGMIASAITDVPGSSAVLDRGFVTYSNDAKREMIGVSQATLDAYGAVSRQTAVEMAQGALARSNADVAISVTGIAGPDGGTEEKPVGLVHMAVAMRASDVMHQELRLGNIGRDVVRQKTVAQALQLLLDVVSEPD